MRTTAVAGPAVATAARSESSAPLLGVAPALLGGRHDLGDEEIVAVILCRFKELELVGCEGSDCLVLASRVDLDLDRAVDLVARGCPPELALRILL